MIVYKATNKINGKCYIGQTIISLKKRKTQHKHYMCNNKGQYFHNALRKYGWYNFIWEILCECQTKDELNEMEFHYIKQLGSYNLTEGGGSNSGYKHTKEAKNKIRTSLTGRSFSKEHLENMRLCQIGKTHSKETKKKMSDLRKGHNWNKKGSYNILSKQYIITYPDGHKETIIGINQFCKDNNLNTSNMIQVAKGKRKQHKRFKCCYKEIICE